MVKQVYLKANIDGMGGIFCTELLHNAFNALLNGLSRNANSGGDFFLGKAIGY